MFHNEENIIFGENCIERTGSSPVGRESIYDPLALSAKQSTG